MKSLTNSVKTFSVTLNIIQMCHSYNCCHFVLTWVFQQTRIMKTLFVATLLLNRWSAMSPPMGKRLSNLEGSSEAPGGRLWMT